VRALNSLVILLALAGPGLDDLFDPLSPKFPISGARLKIKRTLFTRLLGEKGPATMLKAMAKCEPAVVELRKHRASVHKEFLKLRAQYFGWIEEYRKSYRRKNKRDPGDYPMPESLEKAYIAKELAIKEANSIVLRELRFYDWALDQLATHPLDKKFRAAALAGVRKKNVHHALRCIRVLRGDAQLRRIKLKSPIVSAALIEACGGPFVRGGDWRVLSASAQIMGPDDIASAVAVWKTATGLVRDDLNQGLTRLNGGEVEDWAAWLAELPEDWKPEQLKPAPLRGKGAKVDGQDSRAVVVPTPSGRSCFGLPTGSQRFILCVPANSPGVNTEIERFLGSVPSSAEFALIVFGAGAAKFRKKMVANSGGNRAAALKWLQGRHVTSGMDTYSGLDLALTFAAKADTLILVSPGRPTARDYSAALVCSSRQIGFEIEYRNRLHRLRILAFGRSTGGESFYLQRIVRPYGGGFRQLGR